MTRELGELGPCERYAAAILDPQAQRPAGMEAHLAACPQCRTLATAHDAAVRLSLLAAPVQLPRPCSMESVVARVRRRRRARGAALALAALVAVLAVSVMRRPRAPVPGETEDLFALADTVATYAHRDIAGDDPALGSLAPMAGWFAAPRRLPFELYPYAPPARTAGGESR